MLSVWLWARGPELTCATGLGVALCVVRRINTRREKLNYYDSVFKTICTVLHMI